MARPIFVYAQRVAVRSRPPDKPHRYSPIASTILPRVCRLATRASASRASIQRQHRLDLWTQLAGIDQLREFLQPLPAAVGGERFAGDATLQLRKRALQDDEVRPTAIAYRADGFVTGLAAGAIQQHIDAARNRRAHLLNPVSGVVIEHVACAQAPQVVVAGGGWPTPNARAP